jgi:hypothetical protein
MAGITGDFCTRRAKIKAIATTRGALTDHTRFCVTVYVNKKPIPGSNASTTPRVRPTAAQSASPVGVSPGLTLASAESPSALATRSDSGVPTG